MIIWENTDITTAQETGIHHFHSNSFPVGSAMSSLGSSACAYEFIPSYPMVLVANRYHPFFIIPLIEHRILCYNIDLLTPVNTSQSEHKPEGVCLWICQVSPAGTKHPSSSTHRRKWVVVSLVTMVPGDEAILLGLP